MSGSANGTITDDNSENYGWRLFAGLGSRVGLPGGGGRLDLVHYINGSGNPLPSPGQTYSDGGLYTIKMNFLFGTPIDLKLDATASTTGHAGCSFQYACTNSQSFDADLSHTITWQGISVTDGTGHAVQNFTAWNPTGNFNYASPVPEPSSDILLSVGLAALLGFVDCKRMHK